MDNLSSNLINLLNSESKIKISEISEKLNVSRNTIKSRLSNLKKNHVIENFSIVSNPNILNQDYAFILIKTNPQEYMILEELKKIPQIKMVDGIFGEYSLLVKCIFNNKEEFNQTLQKFDFILSTYSRFKKYRIIEAIKIYKINGINLANIPVKKDMKIDEIDYAILQILNNQQLKYKTAHDITISLRERNLEISQSGVYKRIKSLEDNYVILRHVANFYPKSLNFLGKFILMLKPKDPIEYGKFADNFLQKYPEIKEIYRTGEVFALLAIVRVKKIEDYGNLLLNLYDTDKIEDTYTYFVLDERYPTSFPTQY
ncbi:MAG: Lrp/AsnC family transcriptional regulator [Candidatus Lokiarchaeota archaeon]|nr:Lrp/AsnC family transcriptional regulator [Candidatus Lokiarchaeota archaeon]